MGRRLRPERLREPGDDCATQRLGRGIALAGAPVAQPNDRLRHRAMAAGGAEIAERVAHDVTRRANPAHVAHGDVQLAVYGTRYDGPLRTFDLQEEVGELRDELRIGDAAEVREDRAVLDVTAGDAPRQHVERLVGQV